jgi:hypothetical protein
LLRRPISKPSRWTWPPTDAPGSKKGEDATPDVVTVTFVTENAALVIKLGAVAMMAQRAAAAAAAAAAGTMKKMTGTKGCCCCCCWNHEKNDGHKGLLLLLLLLLLEP